MRGPALRLRRAARSTVYTLGFVITVVLVSLWVGNKRLASAFGRMLDEHVAPSAVRPVGLLPDTFATVRVATYNVWALPVWLPGTENITRLPSIPPALDSLDADVIVLQEAFQVEFRRFAMEYLGGYQVGEGADCFEPLSFFGQKDCTGGLLTLSRFPVLDEEFTVHALGPEAKWDERRGRKGFLVTRLNTPAGEVALLNVHLYAGRTTADEEVRMSQVRRLGQEVSELDGELPVILVGDLNTVHPDVANDSMPASKVYAFVTDSLGFTDVGQGEVSGRYTYDVTQNPYAALWYNRFEGRQIFDYVLVRSSSRVEVRPRNVSRILTGDRVLSDHFGIVVDLDLSRRTEASQP